MIETFWQFRVMAKRPGNQRFENVTGNLTMLSTAEARARQWRKPGWEVRIEKRKIVRDTHRWKEVVRETS